MGNATTKKRCYHRFLACQHVYATELLFSYIARSSSKHPLSISSVPRKARLIIFLERRLCFLNQRVPSSLSRYTRFSFSWQHRIPGKAKRRGKHHKLPVKHLADSFFRVGSNLGSASFFFGLEKDEEKNLKSGNNQGLNNYPVVFR